MPVYLENNELNGYKEKGSENGGKEHEGKCFALPHEELTVGFIRSFITAIPMHLDSPMPSNILMPLDMPDLRARLINMGKKMHFVLQVRLWAPNRGIFLLKSFDVPSVKSMVPDLSTLSNTTNLMIN
jgi:hypothetical protein